MVRNTASLPLLLLFTILAFSTLLTRSHALRLHGTTVAPSSTFQYLEKFVFDTTGGNFTASTASTLPTSTPSNQRVLIYPDTVWAAVLSSDNCTERVELGKGAAVGVPLHVQVTGHRPHWWYVAVVDCDYGNSTGLGLQYDFHFTAGGGTWVNEVSYDQQHIAEISLTYFLFFLLLVPLFVASALKARSTYTQVPHILLTAIAATLSLAYLLYAVEYLALVRTGDQHVSLSSAAYFFQQLAATMLIFSILSTSAGYPLTRPMIAHFPAILATALAVFGLYVASYVVRQYTQPAWSSQYVFNNSAGYALAILYGLLVPVSFALLRSTQRLPNPSAAHHAYFYSSYALFASSYLLSVPFITLGTSLADTWWVAKAELAATGCVLCLAVFGQWVFFQPFTAVVRQRRFKTLDEAEQAEVSKVAVLDAGEAGTQGESDAVAAEGALEGEADSGDVEMSVHHISVSGSGSVVPV